jgi:phage gp46-like protein
MTDIALVWNQALGRADIAMSGPDLQMDDTLQTEIIIRLFSDRLAGPGDTIPDSSGDPRGWWGDAPLPTDPSGTAQDLTGSKFWLYVRALQTPETLNEFVAAANEALQPMVAAGEADSITVSGAYPQLGWIELTIDVVWRGVAVTYVFNVPLSPTPMEFLADPGNGFLADPVGGFLSDPV